MKEFDNWASCARKTTPKIAFCAACLVAAFASRCITVDKYGNPLEPAAERKDRQYDLAEMKPAPDWSAEDRRIPIALAGIPDFPPDRFVLDRLPEVGNQGNQASGTAWAVGAATSYYFRQQHAHKSYTCAPAYLYNQLNGGEDRGIEIVSALRLLKNGGCPEEKNMPYAEKDYLRRPGPGALLSAGNYVIQGYGRVDFTDVNQVRAHLLQKKVVVATLRITHNFLELDDRVWQKPAGAPVGRHTVAIVGYDHPRERFIIQNSVGEDWGDDGFAEIPYEWFIRLAGQAYVIW